MATFSLTSEENIKVIVRIKPNKFTDKSVISTVKDSNIIVHGLNEYIFDKVADENYTQMEIFECCKSLFQSFINGYNATIFAYGQTGSGKTFTMAGDNDEQGTIANQGLIPRGLSYIFNKVIEKATIDGLAYLIKCSFVEIYNEQIYDLLDPQQQRLNLRFNITNEVYLEQCTERMLNNPKMAEKAFKDGLSNRSMAFTQMNRESSRSHAVFTIFLELQETPGNLEKYKKSSLHLVDLAGSERQRDAITDGNRLKEAGMINKSLLALSKVITILANPTKLNMATYIPYRDSKLTLLLKDAIGGNSKTTLVACVHNDSRYSLDTVSTLKFASSAKTIKNKAKINIDNHGDIESLRKEIDLLHKQIESAKLSQTIPDHEYLVWKKRFITAMALRSCTCMDISTLQLQVTSMNKTICGHEKHIDNLKVQLELEVNKYTSLEYKYSGNEKAYAENENDTKILIGEVSQKLADNSQKIPNQINNDQLQIQVNYLANELEKADKLNYLSAYEQTLTHSLIKDYNTIVESDDFNDIIKRSDASNVEITQLHKELSQLRSKNSFLKKKIDSLTIGHCDEQRKLVSKIAAMKLNLEAVDQQREVAVTSRRRTLLSFISDRNSADVNYRPITKELESVILNDNEAFIPLEEKRKDENANQLDGIRELEADLLAKQTEIVTLQCIITEYQKEVDKHRKQLLTNEGFQQNLNEMTAKHDIVAMSLQESKETVERLKHEGVQREALKDNEIKVFIEKTFCLEEDLEKMERENVLLNSELDRISLLKDIETNKIEKLEKSLNKLQQENDQKEKNIVSLNSKTAEQSLALIDKSPTKTESENRTLNEQINENQQNESVSIDTLRIHNDDIDGSEPWKQNTSYTPACDDDDIVLYQVRIQSLNEELQQKIVEIENLQTEKDELALANEQMTDNLNDEQRNVKKLTLEYDNKVAELKKKHADKQREMESKMAIRLQMNEARSCNQLNTITSYKSQVIEYIKELNIFKKRKPEGGAMQGPMTSLSPLAQSFIKDNESRNSIVEELFVSIKKTEQELKNERKTIAILDTMMGNIILCSELLMPESTVGKMEAIQGRLESLEQYYKEMSIKKLSAYKEEICVDTISSDIVNNLKFIKSVTVVPLAN